MAVASYVDVREEDDDGDDVEEAREDIGLHEGTSSAIPRVASNVEVATEEDAASGERDDERETTGDEQNAEISKFRSSTGAAILLFSRARSH